MCSCIYCCGTCYNIDSHFFMISVILFAQILFNHLTRVGTAFTKMSLDHSQLVMRNHKKSEALSCFSICLFSSIINDPLFCNSRIYIAFHTMNNALCFFQQFFIEMVQFQNDVWRMFRDRFLLTKTRQCIDNVQMYFPLPCQILVTLWFLF
jgi:hypothetical protein